MDAYAADATPDAQNTRIPVNEVTGITLIGTIDSHSFSVTIPEAELSLQEITNAGTTDTIVEIKVCDKLDGITKDLVDSAANAPEGLTGVSYPVDGKVTIPEDGTVTLLYKITVTGDGKAEYKVIDEGATPVDRYSLTGQLDTNGVAVIYVTKTFSADDVVNGVLTNSASLSHDNTTLPPDDGNDEAEVEVEVEDEGGEEPEEPDEPSGPTDTDLGKLAVVLECTNDEVEHSEDPKTFNLRTTNSVCTIQQVGEQYICTVTPNYDLMLQRYNDQVADGHNYADEVGSEKTFTLVWVDGAWDNGGGTSITRQVKCEPIVYTIHVSFVGPNGEAYGGGDVISTAPNDSVAIADPVAEGMEFVGWKKLVGLEEIYEGDFTYTALAELVGDSFTPDTHETWLTFEAVFEPIVYTIHVSFVGPNGEAYGGGDVISTAPNDSVAIADPVAEGMEFVGWKKLVGLEEIYEGDFTYTALAELVGDSFTPDTHETWLTFEAVFEPIVYTIHVSFVGPNGEAYGGGDVISTAPNDSVAIADPVAEGMEFVGWKKLVGLEEIYEGDFTYTALAELVGDSFTPDTHETWLTLRPCSSPLSTPSTSASLARTAKPTAAATLFPPRPMTALQ